VSLSFNLMDDTLLSQRICIALNGKTSTSAYIAGHQRATHIKQ